VAGRVVHLDRQIRLQRPRGVGRLRDVQRELGVALRVGFRQVGFLGLGSVGLVNKAEMV
jgi:hypothetical protein